MHGPHSVTKNFGLIPWLSFYLFLVVKVHRQAGVFWGSRVLFPAMTILGPMLYRAQEKGSKQKKKLDDLLVLQFLVLVQLDFGYQPWFWFESSLRTDFKNQAAAPPSPSPQYQTYVPHGASSIIVWRPLTISSAQKTVIQFQGSCIHFHIIHQGERSGIKS